MPVRITVTTTNLIGRLEKIKSNVPKALEATGTFYLTVAQNKISQGDSSWPQWSPNYAKYTKPHQMLWLDGTLLRSLTPGDSNNIFQEGPHSIVIGSNVAYAQAQNAGYQARNLPARPYLVLDDADTNRKAAQVFAKYLLQD